MGLFGGSPIPSVKNAECGLEPAQVERVTPCVQRTARPAEMDS